METNDRRKATKLNMVPVGGTNNGQRQPAICFLSSGNPRNHSSKGPQNLGRQNHNNIGNKR
eukprot:8034667-Lingulodinium_polyedra.AAC.1